MKQKDEVNVYSFASVADANQRLSGAICKIKSRGRWIQISKVRTIDDPNTILYSGTTFDGEIFSGPISDLDFSCPPLGLFNDFCRGYHTVFSAVRQPLKQYRGGINQAAIQITKPLSTNKETMSLFNSAGFFSMLDGVYPDITNIVSFTKPSSNVEKAEIAFRRFHWVKMNEFKISTVFFLSTPICSFTSTGKDITPSFVLNPTTQYHREFIEKDLSKLQSYLKN